MVKPVPSSSSWALKMQMKGRTKEELQSPSPQVFLPDCLSGAGAQRRKAFSGNFNIAIAHSHLAAS